MYINMKTKGSDRQAEQIRLVQEWFDARPKEPAKKIRDPEANGWIVLAFLLAVAGFIYGLSFYGRPVTNDGSTELLVRFAPFIGAALGFIAGLIPFFVVAKIYIVRLGRLGWAEYESNLRRWKLIGDEDFGDWAYTNILVAVRLDFGIGGDTHHYLRRFESRDEKAEKARVYIDDELGALEQTLDNATPGPVSTLSVPSDRKLQREARQCAMVKQATLKKGERFLMQTEFPMKRVIGVNSAGWVSSSGIDKKEEVAVCRRVTSIFESQGLEVKKCWIGWTGMTNGAGGSYEFFTLVVRLA